MFDQAVSEYKLIKIPDDGVDAEHAYWFYFFSCYEPTRLFLV